MLPITRQITRFNKYPGANKIKKIVVHDVGTVSSAKNNADYFAGGNRGASAHYFVDNKSIYQIIDDTDGAWHVGDNKGVSNITNFNSIGIEMCLAGDVEITISHTIELVSHLMKKYGLGLEDVVRHHDASFKRCPNVLSANNWAKWLEFKAKLAIKSKGGSSMDEAKVTKIVEDVVAAEVKKLVQTIKPSVYSKDGDSEKHWAYPDVVELNGKGMKISELRLDDTITRAEVFSLIRRCQNCAK